MTNFSFPDSLAVPIDAIIFDCDGTLAHIEGIDELARANQVGEQVSHMTAVAMAQTGLDSELYQRRLELVRPTYQQAFALAQAYADACNEDVVELIQVLSELGKAVFIVSAGVNPAVCLFAEHLGVLRTHSFAVDLTFDHATGEYLDFDRHSPLVRRGGKRTVVAQIQAQYPRTVYVGDGLNDLEVSDMVTRFIGYGGSYYRANIAEQCEYYLRHASLAPMLPLALTDGERQQLSALGQQLYHKGMQCLENNYINT